MKLIDRYVTEVGRRLPFVQGRADIEKELRSTLEDMLEDRAAKAGRAADEAMEVELLKEYGAPGEVAATYNPQPYLIGPRMFPFFTRVLQIVLFAIVIAFVVMTAIKIASISSMAGPEFVKAVGEGLGGIVSAAIGAFGNIVLIFALIERFVPVSDFKMDEEKDWDPASLKKEPEPNEVKVWEPIFAIVFIFIAMSILNFNRDLLTLSYGENGIWFIGFGSLIEGQKGFIPLFSDAFFRWLPLMNAALLAEIVLNGMLIRSGRWDLMARLFSIAIKILQIVINLLLLSGPFILGITAGSLTSTGLLDAETAETIGSALERGVPIILGLAIFGKLIEIAQTAYKAVTRK